MNKYDDLELGWYLIKLHRKPDWELMELVAPNSACYSRVWKHPNRYGSYAGVAVVGPRVELPAGPSPEPEGIHTADALMGLFNYKRVSVEGNTVTYEHSK